jgi:eukaryotic-like serine/threonine-protein kinase
MRSVVEEARPLSAPADVETTSWGFEEGDEIYRGRHALTFLGGGRRYEAYLAYDEELLTTVVVKILRPARVGDPRALDGLAAEFRALSWLNHPVIARAYDCILDGPRPHITLEYLDGPRLSTLIRKYGYLPVEQAVPLALQLCSALHYMHQRRWVHLDVKPRNIIMGGPPRLIDLSVARTLKEAAELDTIVGTDAYMAPEQCDPGGARVIGPPADVWGLGVVLYQSLATHLPFPSRDEGGCDYPQLEYEPYELMDEDVPLVIREIVSSCLRFDPAQRPSPKQISTALEPVMEALPRRLVLGSLRPGLG